MQLVDSPSDIIRYILPPTYRCVRSGSSILDSFKPVMQTMINDLLPIRNRRSFLQLDFRESDSVAYQLTSRGSHGSVTRAKYDIFVDK
jgi:hypothetical protein